MTPPDDGAPVDLDAERKRRVVAVPVAHPPAPGGAPEQLGLFSPREEEATPSPEPRTIPRLSVALTLRGIEAADLATDFVGWNAIDVERDANRASRGEYPWRATLGPELEPIDPARLDALLAGAVPTEGEAATLSSAFCATTGEEWPRRFFRLPPLQLPERIHICGPDMHAETTCYRCGAEAAYLCDALVTDRLLQCDGGTCDRAMCAEHAIVVGDDEHRCSEHRRVKASGAAL